MDVQQPAATPSTPSPTPDGLRTPPAPRFGYQDHWEPYSPRKSARISSQQADSTTPPPKGADQKTGSPRSSRRASVQSGSAMASPVPSPRKRRQPPADSTRRVSGSLTSESTAHAAAALGLGESSTDLSAPSTSSRAMLPTPSKTPQKPPSSKTAAHIDTFARNLFPSDDASIRGRRGKKYSGMTMDSFTVEDDEAPISIFTDSHDRVPTKDTSSANPFYVDPKNPQGPKERRGKQKQVNIPGEGSQSVVDAARREDGMVYVFRGKRFFRKFSNSQEEGADDDQEGIEQHLSKPLTRSAIKPRLLFPQEKNAAELEEEEADTDVEEDKLPSAKAPQTPSKSRSGQSKITDAPKYAPVSPPDTGRATRSANKLGEPGTPMKKKPRQRSIFDSWPRTKEHKTQTGKRTGEPISEAPAKRTRA